MFYSTGACIIKLITAVINSVTQKASVFVKASKSKDSSKGVRGVALFRVSRTSDTM